MPELKIIADLHTHTLHSHAANTSFEMFEAGRKKGLEIIGFSEHSPRPKGYRYLSDYQDKLRAGFPLYVDEVKRLKKNESGLEILLGVEVDYIPAEKDYAKKLCAEYEYDYIIGGLHFQGNWGFDGPEESWLKLSQKEKFNVYTQYYLDLKDMAETGLFNIVAHPDLIKIHTKADFDIWLEKKEATEIITDSLKAFKKAGMAMEISSAGLRKPCKEIYPGPKIMEIAQSLELPISFGSDAHCIKTPAYAFNELASYARAYGYSESLIFRKKKAFTLKFKS